MKKVIVSLLVLCILLVSAYVPVSAATVPIAGTGENYLDLSTLADMSRAYQLPDLSSTTVVTQNDKTTSYETCSVMTPQGVCVTEQYVLVSAYCAIGKYLEDLDDYKLLGNNKAVYDREKSHKRHHSVIFVYNKSTKAHLCTLSLSDSPHVGGIAYDGNYVWVCKSNEEIEKNKLEAIDITAIDNAVRSGERNCCVPYVASCNCYCIASFVSFFEGNLWVGEFDDEHPGTLNELIIEGSGSKMTLTKRRSFSIPAGVNGADFYRCYDKLFLAVNTSYGRNKNSITDIYRVNESSTGDLSCSRIKQYTLPPMAEEICINGNDVYTLFESASTAYSTVAGFACSNIIDKVCVGDAEDWFGVSTSNYAGENCDPIDVYFINSKEWDTVNIYTWGPEPATWPGWRMSYVGVDKSGYEIYRAQIDRYADGIVFTNGSGTVQTVDVTTQIANNSGWYAVNNSSGVHYGVKHFTYTGNKNTSYLASADNPCKGTIYYNNSSTKLSQVYCYMWKELDDGTLVKENAVWPGERMTYVGDDIWSYTLKDDYNWLIFTDSSGGGGYLQTDDLPYPGNNKQAYGYFSETFSGRLWNNLTFRIRWENKTSKKLDPVDTSSAEVTTSGNGSVKNYQIGLVKSFGFTVPSGVPIIGGGKVKLDLSGVPVSGVVKDNKLYVIIGVYNGAGICTDTQKWSDFKNYVNKNEKDLSKGRKKWGLSGAGKVTAGFGKSNLVCDFYGYFEASIKNGTIVPIGGKANLRIDKTVSAVIPVGINALSTQVSGKVSENEQLRLSLDGSTLKFADELDLTLPKISASSGVNGLSLTDVSPYGEGRNEIRIINSSRMTGTLYGEMGVSARALIFSDKIPLFKYKNGWKYYDSAKTSSGITASTALNNSLYDASDFDYKIDRSYIDSQSPWYGTVNSRRKVTGNIASEGFTETTLQSSVYNGASPKMIRAGENLIAVWTGDDPDRSTGNETVVYYSVCNIDGGTFSAPFAVEDNGTADFYPDIVSDGENTYVAWVDADRTFDESVSMTEMAGACEIKIAKLNPATMRFENVQRLTDNAVLDIKPSVYLKNGKAAVVWKSNSENNLFGTSGTESIRKAEEQNDGTFSSETIYSGNNAIYELVGSAGHIAFTTDTDITTAEDIEVKVISADGAVTQLTDNDEQEHHLAFSTIDGETMLTYSCGGTIHGSSDMTDCTALTDEETQINGSYQFVSSGGVTKLYSAENKDNACEIYTYAQDNSGIWSGGLQVSDTGAYIQSPSFVMDDNGVTRVFYAKTSVTMTEESVQETTDLCTARINLFDGIDIKEVVYENTDITPGHELPVTLSVANTGTISESGVEVTVTNVTDEVMYHHVYEGAVNSGAVAEYDFVVPVSEDISALTEYKISVNYPGKEDLASDETIIRFGYTSLQLNASVGAKDGEKGIVLNILNKSSIPTAMTLNIKASEEAAEPLDSYSIGQIEGKEEKVFFIDKETAMSYLDRTDTLYFEIVSSKEEEDVADNIDAVVIKNAFDDELFILGDADGDGSVMILDATCIQRYLVDYEVNDPETVVKCGDVTGDGLDITDATFIQRYLVEYNTPYQIGQPIA